MPRHVIKGDQVMVTAGNDKGVTGEILRIITKKNRVVVHGVNIRSKHLKPSQASPQGGIVRREMPIHISNVSPVVDGKPTRVRFETTSDGSKVRIAVKGGKVLPTRHGGAGSDKEGRVYPVLWTSGSPQALPVPEGTEEGCVNALMELEGEVVAAGAEVGAEAQVCYHRRWGRGCHQSTFFMRSRARRVRSAFILSLAQPYTRTG
ncbi:MAG: 50S ribosomal protein L24 [Candidatus Marinimicrobia bacterium]|nr:50S ribosomal protein L24 [Candidatus Neomarinimicrobiota bacterium]